MKELAIVLGMFVCLLLLAWARDAWKRWREDKRPGDLIEALNRARRRS